MSYQFLPALLVASAAMLQGAQPILIQNARVFDGVQILPRASVLVVDSKIQQVGRDLAPPPGAQIIDAAGKTLLPALIDAHAHTLSPDDLKAALGYGVATYLDMFTLQGFAAAMRAEQQAGKGLDRADLRSAGTLVTAKGGHGTEYGVPIPTLDAAKDAQAFVDARIAEGSDYIKVIKDDGSAFGMRRPTLDRETVAAVIAAAHARKKLAIVHIATSQDAREALAAGADGLAHIYSGAPDETLAREAARRGATWTPTLAVITQNCAKDCAAALGIVRQMKGAGVRILAGTDVPNPGTRHGASLHDELELLVKAGLTPVEALAAATSGPSAAYGLADRGRIAPGLRADLLLVDGQADVDIGATRKIAGVWKLGVAVARPAAVAAPVTMPAGARPDFTGTWKMNETESGATPAGVHEVVFTIEHKDPRFKYAATGKRGFSGFSEAYECTTDGALPSDPTKVAMVCAWQGNALALSLYKDGKELMKFLLTADDKRMMREADLPGGRKLHEVYDRQ